MEEQDKDNPGFNRLMDLLHSSYLRKGVRNSVASKLEEVSECTVYSVYVAQLINYFLGRSSASNSKKMLLGAQSCPF